MPHKQTQEEFSYKVLETNEDPFEQLIEKSGIKTSFKLNDIKTHQQYLKKQLVNLSTKKMAHDAQIILLTNRHPEYADIHEADLSTCLAYCAKKLENVELEDEIKSTEELIVQYDEEMEAMCKALDIHVVDPKDLETKAETPNA